MTTQAAVPTQAGRSPARVRLRPTMQSDIDFVLTLERDPANLPFITPWDRTQHEAAIRFPDFRHFVIEGGPGFEPAGFLILIGCRSPHQAIELKRVVVRDKGHGIGRAALRVAKRLAFDDLGAHRFWLDVRTHNTRALGLYDSEGFVREGTLRECVQGAQGRFDSLAVMSLLAHEFGDRRALGLELPE